MKTLTPFILVLITLCFVFSSCEKKDPPPAPVITTGDVKDIEITKATFVGEVTSDGGSAIIKRGFIYTVNKETPPVIDKEGTIQVSSELGNGTGEYSRTIIDLSPGTNYYVRAYAINSVLTSYGEVKAFLTGELPANAYVERGVYIGVGVNIDGLWWAPVNVGYTEENPYGLLFNWGKNEGFEYGATGQSASDGNWSAQDQGPCPDGWRIPTKQEYESLLINSSGGTDGKPGQWQAARVENPNGLAGRWFGTDCTAATVTTPGNSIFFPAAGYWNSPYNSNFRGSLGNYWSSASGSYLNIGNKYASVYSYGYSVIHGFSLRCVQIK